MHTLPDMQARPSLLEASDIIALPPAARPAASSRPSVLSGSALTKQYRMGEVDVHALRGVDIDLYEGELLVLLGVSGSGKSTLLNILGGLDVCTGGRVVYRGLDLTTADEDDLTAYRRRHVGFVFQFYNLIPSLTARENVALVTEIADGEQQRVAIARAIAKRPDVLLCDEPTGALDFRTGIRVLTVIDRINRELGTTTAVITHNAPIAAIADRTITLADGLIVSEVRNAHKRSPEELSW